MRTIASFDVDPQKTFTPLCPNELPVPGGHEIVDELNEQARLANLRVGSRDAHSDNAYWIAQDAGQVLQPIRGENMDVFWPAHAIVGTFGFELLDGLPHPVTGYDFFVSKGLDPDCHPYGACYHDLGEHVSTGVIEYLKAQGVTDVIVGGLALEYCVFTTVMQLVRAGFIVHLNLAACRGIDPTNIERAMAEMRDGEVRIVENAAALAEVLA